MQFGGRVSATPSVELGLRQDAGDAENGAGIDLGGGLVVHDPKTGLQTDVCMRTLFVHRADVFSERGIAISVGWNP